MLRMKEADEIDGDEGDLFLAVFEDDGAGLERIVNSGRLAIVAETGHVHGFLLHARRDVRLGETGLQTVARAARLVEHPRKVGRTTREEVRRTAR